MLNEYWGFLNQIISIQIWSHLHNYLLKCFTFLCHSLLKWKDVKRIYLSRIMEWCYLFIYSNLSRKLVTAHTHTHTKSPKSTLAGICLPDFLPNLFEKTPLCLLACWQQWLMVLVRVLVSPFLPGKDSDDSANAFWLQ